MADEPPIKPIRIDSTWKLEVDREHYESGDAWANVRIVQDPRRGDDYIDLVIGLKGQDPHAHYGIDRDLSIRFHDDRGRVNSIRREVVDSNLGKVDDKTLMLKPVKGKNSFQIRIYAHEPTRTVRVALTESGFTSP
ncbi:MAG: hypothetical protein L3K10_00515 [Thermoplasmata archaeon]|nr:hypothetical protein [Thermoplasmata archaeon]